MTLDWPMYRCRADRTGCYYAPVVTGDEEPGAAVPAVTMIQAIHPNPFNPATRIVFGLREGGRVRVVVYDAAGREETRFVFYLPMQGSVTLHLWTARGERVRTLLEAASLPAGLYQDETWDGRNGRGETVVNGVYIAELSVDFADGSHERLLRKVAVVR